MQYRIVAEQAAHHLLQPMSSPSHCSTSLRFRGGGSKPRACRFPGTACDVCRSIRPRTSGTLWARALRDFFAFGPRCRIEVITMKLPMTITFRGMNSDEWIETEIRTRAAKLDTYCSDIMSCHVVVEVPHQHHQEGNRFSVRIDLRVPDEEIAVTHGSNLHGATKDLHATEWAKRFDVEGMRKDIPLVIKEAFDVARRRLQDHARRHRLDVKRHEEPPHGPVRSDEHT